MIRNPLSPSEREIMQSPHNWQQKGCVNAIHIPNQRLITSKLLKRFATHLPENLGNARAFAEILSFGTYSTKIRRALTRAECC
jgi:hypothetical protein